MLNFVPISPDLEIQFNETFKVLRDNFISHCNLLNHDLFSNFVLKCEKFTDYNQMSLIDAFFLYANEYNYNGLYMGAENRLLVWNDSIGFGNFFYHSNQYLLYLTIDYFGGFELNAKSQSKFSTRLLSLRNSRLNFYLNQTILIDESSCRQDLIDQEKYPLLEDVRIFEIHNAYNAQSTPICPLIFNNSKIEEINLDLRHDSLIRFINLGSEMTNQFKSNVKILCLSRNHDANQSVPILLNGSILDRNLFKNISKLVLSNLSSIILEKSFLNSFKNLKYIRLKLKDFAQFFRLNKVDWMHDLNSDLILNTTNLSLATGGVLNNKNRDFIKIQVDFTFDFYKFPNEDFCLFYRFPHHRLILLDINFRSDQILNVTCTLLWINLFKDVYNILSNSSDSDNLDTTLITSAKNYSSLVQDCQFYLLIQNCSKMEKSNLNNAYEETSIKFEKFLLNALSSKSKMRNSSSSVHFLEISYILLALILIFLII
jgi:hypothetical protein